MSEEPCINAKYYNLPVQTAAQKSNESHWKSISNLYCCLPKSSHLQLNLEKLLFMFPSESTVMQCCYCVCISKVTLFQWWIKQSSSADYFSILWIRMLYCIKCCLWKDLPPFWFSLVPTVINLYLQTNIYVKNLPSHETRFLCLNNFSYAGGWSGWTPQAKLNDAVSR